MHWSFGYCRYFPHEINKRLDKIFKYPFIITKSYDKINQLIQKNNWIYMDSIVGFECFSNEDNIRRLKEIQRELEIIGLNVNQMILFLAFLFNISIINMQQIYCQMKKL